MTRFGGEKGEEEEEMEKEEAGEEEVEKEEEEEKKKGGGAVQWPETGLGREQSALMVGNSAAASRNMQSLIKRQC